MSITTRTLLLDCHVHIYPSIDPGAALFCALQRLREAAQHLAPLAAPPAFGLVLAERSDCSFFQTLLKTPATLEPEWSLEVLSDKACLLLIHRGNTPSTPRRLYLFAGRQYVTAERLELLCLGRDLRLPEHTSFAEGVQEIQNAGGLAALNWAMGKWWGSRKKVVERLLTEFSPGELLIGDTTLRPRCYTPRLLTQAQGAGFMLSPGSDPLPLPGEEKYLGTYGLMAEVPEAVLQREESAQALKTFFTHRKQKFLGRRCSLPTVLARNARLFALKYRAGNSSA